MYGIVTKAIGDLIVSTYGEDRWEAVRAKAGLEDEYLVSTEPYPDEVAYGLISAACDILECPVDAFMVRFGEHWILETGAACYGPLLKSGGATLREFLLNLPHFHTRVVLLYPRLQPPEFACTDVTENSLRLHYFTARPGLTNFMVGLLRGLSQHYETPISIVLSAAKAEGADHDIFDVAWDAPRK